MQAVQFGSKINEELFHRAELALAESTTRESY
jgi:hypothetical protein